MRPGWLRSRHQGRKLDGEYAVAVQYRNRPHADVAKCGSSDAQSWTSKPADENISEYTSPETSSIDRNIDIAGGVLIHPNGDTTKCLTPSGSSYGDGVPLIL